MWKVGDYFGTMKTDTTCTYSNNNGRKPNNLGFIGKIRSLYISCSGNFASQLINERNNNILCYESGTFNITDVMA
jgi:hypothetical protein